VAQGTENLIQQSADGGIVNVHRAGQREHGEVVVRQRPNSLNQFPLRRIVKCDASATLPSTSSSARPMNILHSFFWRMQLQNELHICKVNATTNNVSGDQNVKPENMSLRKILHRLTGLQVCHGFKNSRSKATKQTTKEVTA